MDYNIYHNNTLIKLNTPLGENTLQFRHMHGHEVMSELFEFDITFATIKKSVEPQQLIGKSVTVSIEQDNSKTRYFNGVVLELSTLHDKSNILYQMKIRPQLALLQYRSNCRIFQNKTVKQIITEILQENKVNYFDLGKIRSTQTPLEYSAQYRESDFDYLTRLLAKAGIYYFFQHDKDKHNLIFADNSQAYANNEKNVSLTTGHVIGINQWRRSQQFFSGKVTYNDHDFMNPDKKLRISAKTMTMIADNTSYEIYEYTGNYQDTTRGDQLVKTHIEAIESQYCHVEAKSNYPQLKLADKITLDAKNFPDEKGNSYVITAITHELYDKAGADNVDDAYIYHNQFTCIPAQTTFHPNISVNKPMAPSVQLAVITGPAGKDIHTDKYGRMKAQFLWDREGKSNETCSCWMRAVQHWDGLLRIGTPVLVGFIDDDMDKPVILGPVYNANLMPIANLIDEQFQSVLKRRHPKKVVEKKYNEICFDDKDSAQELRIYASKNMLVEIEQDSNQKNKNGNYVLEVKGDITIQTEGCLTLDAKKAITIKSAESINISAGKDINLDAKMSLQNKAGNTLKHKANEISQQANTKLISKALEINQLADTKIVSKAAIQNVEASGMLVLKGGLIKEN